MTRIDSETIRRYLKVYFIMGSINCRKNPLEVLQEAIDGGITLFQFREKGKGSLVGEDKLRLAKQLQEICRKNTVPFIVNDDIDLAIELDADGVHIGQEDEPAENVRKRIGSHKIVGVSAHTLEEAQKAIEDGADYLGLGPIFATQTKEDVKAVQGTRLIKLLRQNGMNIPIVGIGGINPDNAQEVMTAGADGVSVITAISHAPSIKDAAARLVIEVR
ncbi:thiamine phosphate synthase [Aneurinibacillus sp. Ricciae_BoGa-3]|uniref:thiamine phosphate synthase n=1 Tax=Aneurinibacillus sp. Ricciae_BoGa-3 TaxID=3022697 RepID=UPI0023411142|nr:thiamine phosphate synthase [Aneurinibacillus sp. Ricciae_BoGa-3]WCK54925.1 thiamine phosphate synthase [Aneurinibacillus sp. Ricciae_BoGa-3]